ncbi:hypothetical protein H8356DRAFT_1420239 [Neocallimastix lanati (nom. inval.)]|nr:hypothetical protein H8356DRAFT_1420239 [Neocallimastix sp. JGI-2020a]
MELKKSSIPYGIKIKPLYNKISNEMRFIFSEYNSIKSQISRNLNKNFHPIYQIFITRTYTKELDSFYTTSFAILKNKEQETYKIFKKLKKKNAYTCNNNIIIAESIKNKRNLENKKRAINKANEISVLIERYKNIETKLIDTKCDRNNTINLWFDLKIDYNDIQSFVFAVNSNDYERISDARIELLLCQNELDKLGLHYLC